MQSEGINELAAALAKAQGEIESATKNAQNPHFKNRYADLAAVWDACRAPLSKNGLSVVQTVENDDAGFCLVTTLCHSSGQWIDSKMHLLVGKEDMQGLGSAITYARRYCLSAIVGIAQEDDDAEGAVNRQAPVAPQAEGPRGVPVEPQAGVPTCCTGPMVLSKFNPNEYYCPKCRSKRPRAA